MERILPLRQRQLQRFYQCENRSLFGNAAFLIIWSAIRRVTGRNGIMFEKILFVAGWSADARIGRFKVKLWRSTMHEGSAASDSGSYNAWNGCIRQVDGRWLMVD